MKKACDHIGELLESYALGALDPDEQAEVEKHLAECERCRARARELAEVVHALPEALAATSPLRPPSGLRESVLQKVARPAAKGPRVRALLRPGVIGAVAAVVVAVLSLAWNAHLSDALSKERSLRSRLAELVGRQEVVLDVVDSRQTERAFLRPPAGSRSNSYGKVFTRPDMAYVVAMAARLLQPRSGYAYHLWLTERGQTRLAGVLAVNRQGFGLLVLRTGRSGPRFDSALLTLQRSGASAPAGRTVLHWEK